MESEMWFLNFSHSRTLRLLLVFFFSQGLFACASDDDVAPTTDTANAQDNPVAVQDGGDTPNPDECPAPLDSECEEKTIWALDPENEKCCEYNGFCKSPEGWEQYKDPVACDAVIDPPSPTCPPPLDIQCEVRPFWAKNPESGECCKYVHPCTTPEGWEKFDNEATCEDPSPSQGGCPPALDKECEEQQVWAYVEEIDACCEYDGVCMIPSGHEQHDKETCEALVSPPDGPPDCPPGKEGTCEEKTIWAKNNSTGTCCVYKGFCHAPDGWETYKDPQTCEGQSE
jgi:hypothetical protein